MHLGKDHMSFKFKKDIYEERQRVNNKYKVRITANLISFISLNILNSCYMQDVRAGGEKNLTVKLGGEADNTPTISNELRLAIPLTGNIR